MSKPFTDVSFPNEHPAASVAEHEVLMSFVNDDDASLFRDWWERWGKHLFGDYVELTQRSALENVRKSGVIPSREEMYTILKKRSEEIKEGRWYDDE